MFRCSVNGCTARRTLESLVAQEPYCKKDNPSSGLVPGIREPRTKKRAKGHQWATKNQGT